MRISDWNSDVCSSDLTRPPLPLDRPFERLDHPILGLRAADPFLHARMADHRLAIGGGKTRQRDRVGDEAGGDGREHDVGRDRKSVVAGKSVTIRVDLVGRSVIKKIMKYNDQQT